MHFEYGIELGQVRLSYFAQLASEYLVFNAELVHKAVTALKREILKIAFVPQLAELRFKVQHRLSLLLRSARLTAYMNGIALCKVSGKQVETEEGSCCRKEGRCRRYDASKMATDVRIQI